MKIDENTRGSIANQEAVGLLRNWMSTLFVADCFVCIVGGLYRGLSGTDMLSAVVKSLFFSYAMGIVLSRSAVCQPGQRRRIDCRCGLNGLGRRTRNPIRLRGHPPRAGNPAAGSVLARGRTIFCVLNRLIKHRSGVTACERVRFQAETIAPRIGE
jgi:hypothetical protein